MTDFVEITTSGSDRLYSDDVPRHRPDIIVIIAKMKPS
jgi:hypothetical protein